MPKYIPFLKAKANEFGAVKSLSKERKQLIVPFFDLPLKKDMDATSLTKNIETASRKFCLNTKGIPEYFVDDYDIPDSILIGGRPSYEYFAARMHAQGLSFNPVVGVDRTVDRNACVFTPAITKAGKNRRIALRVSSEDLISYNLIRTDILHLIAMGQGIYDHWVLVIDNRVCKGVDATVRAAQIKAFCLAAALDHAYEAIVITGSSLLPAIGGILSTNNEIHLLRTETVIYKTSIIGLNGHKVIFGDYTIVSPDYSDSDIDPRNMLNVTAPKVVYSYDDRHYIVRGGGIKTHPRGFKQYNDIAATIVAKTFFRHGNSEGDLYLVQKAAGLGSTVMPGSILKPTINSHIAFMLDVL
ncbi:beta family protein [Pseudomonas alliivorans]|uniref:Beta family protein n=1 Tax=Pseudomonas alliivorans TaxID=2810613 RepID=A0ABS4C5U1_9PSED|nr:beta family protein [Pseudomonas alliivorans]MBP0946027.1 beta family protein [Pseudomonas alliivorans]MEE4326548.1 beta family protein [Pseudomonas alliivorans]MEE4368078.1 beta family protein [Pseudomonas alliivorans]MEE5083895.1 beta family protein [Pseudomonas alliivorans]